MATWRQAFDLEAKRLGLEVLPLVVEPESWILRRVENISITSQRLMRRTVSVDVSLPPVRDELHVTPGARQTPLVLPLGLLRKQPLIDFELREGGRSVMLLQSELNSRLAAGMLWNLAVLDGCTVSDADRAMDALQRIAAPDVDDAHRAYDDLFLTSVGVGVSASARALAARLRDAYVLFVEVPETGEQRRLFHFATDQVTRAGHLGRIERFGMRRSIMSLDVPSAAQSASYHVEVTVPAGCEIVDPRIVVRDGTEVPAKVHLLGNRATVYPMQRHGEEPRLRFALGQAAGYFLGPATVIAWLAVAIFAAGTAVVWAGGQPESAASTILLSGLGAVSGLVIRSDEAALTSEIHSWLRYVLTAVTVATLTGAAAIAFGADGTSLGVLWSGLLAVSVVGAGILSVAARTQIQRST